MPPHLIMSKVFVIDLWITYQKVISKLWRKSLNALKSHFAKMLRMKKLTRYKTDIKNPPHRVAGFFNMLEGFT